MMEKYAKIKKIGEGSFGVAYLARSKDVKDHGKQVVLKEINMTKMLKKERDEARKEVAVLAQLKHSNIVCYLESFEESGSLCIVMDYCDGGDLYSRITAQRGTLFPEEQVLDWFVQMCLAIKHIHDRKILHRDIKSQNIFLTRHGIVKLGDFGIAKVLNSTVELAKTCIGTPYYLSPEICEARPYNNKSDIWSLGCVLYELTTLKHAFEAGNMKMLAMKIIRGNYPPPSAKYTSDLRVLISELFRRNPRDRPSINTVLKKPLLQAKIRKFLSEFEFAEEFSHTVMHGHKIQKALPSNPSAPSPRPAAARPLPPKPIAARKPPTPARYNPASVYAPQAARKSKDSKEVRKSSESRKSAGSSGSSKPSSGAGGVAAKPAGASDLAKKRQEMIEKEKRRQDELKKKESEIAKQHHDLIEKQKVARMQKLREEGWKNILGNSDGDPAVSTKRDDGKPAPVQVGGVREIGNYDQHFANLRRLDEQRPVNGAAAALQPSKYNNAVQAAKQGQIAGNAGAAAAERARVQREFFQRRREAALNRVKGQGGLAADMSPRLSPGPAGDWAKKPDDEQENMKVKLNQIRQRNLQLHQRNISQAAAGRPIPAAVDSAAELRKKKIEAIKVQAAEMKEKKLKDELERKRREGYELEQKRLQVVGRPVSAPAERPVGEVCPVRLTAAMQAIGGSVQQGKETDKSYADIKKEKEGILKRINAKPPTESKGAERPKWGGGEVGVLEQLSLEETRSCMESTSQADKVSPPVARKQWATPRGTVVNILSKANMSASISQATQLEPTARDVSERDQPTESVSEVITDLDHQQELSAPDVPVPSETAVDDDGASQEVIEIKPRGTFLAQVLKTGQFDAVDVKLLRTCSEPDLSQPSQSAETNTKSEHSDVRRRHSDGELADDETTQVVDIKDVDIKDAKYVSDEKDSESANSTDEDNDTILYSFKDMSLADDNIDDDDDDDDDNDEAGNDDKPMDVGELEADTEAATEDVSSCAGDDVSDKEDSAELQDNAEKAGSDSDIDDDCDDSEEDMRTMRASMASILANNNPSDDEQESLSAAVKTKKQKTVKKSKTAKKTKKKKSKDASSSESTGSLPRAWSDTSIEDLQTMKETMKSLLQPESSDGVQQSAVKSVLSTIQESVSASVSKSQELTSVSHLPNQSDLWLSDDADDDYFEEGFEIFSRLEEMRAGLEETLGLETFINAYRTVQSFHDDDDDNMEEGIKQVTKILGHDKVQHYPAILQLVMADGAYMEGND